MKITAEAVRSGKWWVVTVPAVDGAFTQAKRLDHVEDMARSVVEDLLEIDGSTLDVTLNIDLPEDQRRLVDEARSRLAFSDWAAKAAAAANREAVLGLRLAGMTTREVATVLGITAGRVNQIESKARGTHDHVAQQNAGSDGDVFLPPVVPYISGNGVKIEREDECTAEELGGGLISMGQRGDYVFYAGLLEHGPDSVHTAASS